MRIVVVLAIVLVGGVLAGCAGPEANSPDFTAPRDGTPSTPYNEVGPDPPDPLDVNRSGDAP